MRTAGPESRKADGVSDIRFADLQVVAECLNPEQT
jgi:hypothetical protein